jgi:signal transduction histidine kinase
MTQKITELERLLASTEAALAQALRTSAQKDEFLATLSHELRSPLSAILGWVHILRRGPKTPEDLAKGLDVIERNTRAQARLIDDLMDMTRMAAGKVQLDIQPLDPVAVIEAALEAARPSADAKQIRIARLLDATVGKVPGDPARLQQIMANLLSNAIKFTPAGGGVEVLLKRVGAFIEITVADTGIGIKPDFVDHVFERFRQADSTTAREYGGLGLGLPIVRNLTELHGGTVHVMSAGQGQGAAFIVRLPALA